jgi:hypothetical protein
MVYTPLGRAGYVAWICAHDSGAAQALLSHAHPALQAWPHVPQLPGSVPRFTSQPSAFVPLQSAKPVMQERPQVAPLQKAVALADPHGSLQPPQLAGSCWVSTHALPQSVVPSVHSSPQAPPEQTWPVAHTFPHAPQLEGSTLVSTQAPLQSMDPPEQAIPQAPPEQT